MFIFKKIVPIRTSETVRTPPKITSVVKAHSFNRTIIDTDFLFWIAGLIDRDGHFYIRDSVHPKTKKVLKQGIYPRFEITTHIVEAGNLWKIKNRLGFSKVTKKTKIAVQYRLSKVEHTCYLVKLINGKFRLSKRISQFSKVCDKHQIKIKPKKSRNLSSNAWLTGFFEAAGHFSMNRKTFQLRIRISQIDKPILDEIKSEFGGNIYRCFSKKSDSSYWVYDCTAKKDVQLFLNYFSRYGFKGPKAVQLVRFNRLFWIKNKKYHYSTNKIRKKFLKNVHIFLKDKNYVFIIEKLKIKLEPDLIGSYF